MRAGGDHSLYSPQEPERDKYRVLRTSDRALGGLRQLDSLLMEVGERCSQAGLSLVQIHRDCALIG